MEDIKYEVWAASIQDGYIGNLVEIVDRAGGARSLYETSTDELCTKLNISKKLANHINRIKQEYSPQDLYEDMLSKGIRYIGHEDVDYPKRLKNIESKPYGIFVKGSLPSKDDKFVAIIGARECTEYGRLMAQFFADRLARQGVSIVSGMAWGIDGIAQMSAIKAGGKSFGVLGCGVDVIYPSKNHKLYNMLLENGSGIISEYAIGTKAQARFFPPRNRIISALSDVVLVVEARAKSGTLITVDMAIEQNKTVMIVPGRLTDPLSVGCLNLLKDGAIPAVSVESVLRELNIETKKAAKVELTDELNQEKVSRLSLKEQKLYNTLGVDPTTPDEISRRTNMEISEVLAILTTLIIKGYAKEIYNMNFVKVIKIN